MLRTTDAAARWRAPAGLAKAKFKRMTQIQRVAIPHGLAGRDVLGAAKTGSGKTLAFLIPVVEALYRARWSREDGLGALVISPTRELALQIFEVLRSVCASHFSLTAGFVTGGKPFMEEQYALAKLNIIVCTPGRLLQHLEQTPGFDVSACKVLVLDEADRLLDMGFAAELNAIVSYLPSAGDRQTLLFSATQTKSVRDLARLNLRDPCYVAVHEKAHYATPAQLTQNYVVCALPDKLNLLYSFVKSHLKQKTIVFVTACKQARFMYEAFRRLRPGVPVTVLHGKQKQRKRMVIYYDFVEKPAALMFCTDVAARGLDFPSIDWVVQMDCPDSTEMYIHRVGRTARYRKKGKSLMMLLPSEAPAMTNLLETAKIPISKITINPSKAISVTTKLASQVAADPDLKYLAQRAFASYVRSVYLQPNKEVFDVSKLPLDDFAASIGLASAPQIKILKDNATWETSRKAKNHNQKLQRLKASIAAAKAAKRAAREAAGGAGKSGAPDGDSSDSDDSDEYGSQVLAPSENEDSSDEDDVLRPVRRSGAEEDDEEPTEEALLEGVEKLGRRERERVKRITAETTGKGEGARGADGLTPFERIALEMAAKERAAAGGEAGADANDPEAVAAAAEQHRAQLKAEMAKRDLEDRARDRERVRKKHREKRLKAREERRMAAAGLGPSDGVSLAVDAEPSSDSGGDEESDSGSSAGGAAAAKANGGRRAGSDSDSSDSDSESESSSDDSSDDGSANASRPKAKKRGAASLEDTEAQALALLKAHRRRLGD